MTLSNLEHSTDQGHGIIALDSGYGREQHVAVHLMIEGSRAAIIDTAHNASVPRVMQALAANGISAEQVDWVILTHVHLDHAGGAGQLMSQLPNARLTVHPRGARHMIDPTALFAGTVAVYGDTAARQLYGEIIPVPAERIIETPEGARIDLAGRTLRFLETPGHARHHVCIHDERSASVFTGDTFGVSYREHDHQGQALIFPTTSPTQFDPEQMHRSIDRILALSPNSVFLTHFSRVDDVDRLGLDLHRLVDAHAQIAIDCSNAGSDRVKTIEQQLGQLFRDECVRHGMIEACDPLPQELQVDVELNAAGLDSWLQARARH